MEDSDNLLKIRELLFGSSLKELDERFFGLEKSIKESVQARHSALEDKLAALVQQLDEESVERNNTEELIRQEIDKLHAKLDQQHNQVALIIENLSKRIADQQAAFETAVDEKIESIQRQMLQQLDLLKQSKLERASFAELLSNMAGQLSDPKPEDIMDSAQTNGED